MQNQRRVIKCISITAIFVTILWILSTLLWISSTYNNTIPVTLSWRKLEQNDNRQQNDKSFKLNFECIVNNNTQAIFDNIYDTQYWKEYNPKDFDWESKSGSGSSLKGAFDTILYLKQFIKNHSVTSFADIPCGDTNWQFSAKELNTMIYFGGDISSVAIKDNQFKYRQHRNKLFREWDPIQCMIPQYNYNNASYNFDFVLTRDVLQHLSLNDGMKFIKNVVLSNVSYWGVTTHVTGTNVNVSNGYWYQNNLEKNPFNLNKSNANIIFQGKSHVSFKAEADFLYIYKIDEKIKNYVSMHY
eukprot:452410_1